MQKGLYKPIYVIAINKHSRQLIYVIIDIVLHNLKDTDLFGWSKQALKYRQFNRRKLANVIPFTRLKIVMFYLPILKASTL